MESKLNDDQLKNDPFELAKQSESASVFTMFQRAFGYVALAAYGVWALKLVTANMGNLVKLESDALSSIAALINGGGLEGGLSIQPLFFIFICIWCLYYLIIRRTVCFWVIVYRWKWIWVKVAEFTLWGRIIRIWALVLVLCQFIYCFCITIVTIIVVWVNIRVLVGVIF